MTFFLAIKRLWPRRFAAQVALLGFGVILVTEASYTLYMGNEHADFAAQIVEAQSRALAGNLAAAATANVVAGDLDRVEQLLMQSMSSPDVLSLYVVDLHGRTLAGAGRDADGAPQARFGGRFPPPGQIHRDEPAHLAAPHGEPPHAGTPHAESLRTEPRTVWQPIRAGSRLGWVRVEYGLDTAHSVRQRVWRDNLVAGLVILALSMSLLLAFAHRPLRELTQATAFAACLDRRKGEQMPVADSNSELEILTTALNDVSEYLRREEAELQLARDEALAASKAKGDFIANVSHEIRTPMNAILGLTQIALDADNEVERRAAIVKVGRSANLLLRLINDVLDISKIEAGMLEIEALPFSMDELTGGLADLFASALQERGIVLAFDVAPELRGRLLSGDSLRLHQVFQNLIGNAAKFTERGEIAVRMELSATDADGITCLASVADTGIGIPAERIGTLFQPFVQVDGSITRRFGGTGLGLAISRSIVWAMGGEIGVDSRPGEGSRFWFTVRLGYGDTGCASASASASNKSATGAPCRRESDIPAQLLQLRGHRALLVEDNRVNQEVALHFLRRAGLTVDVAEHGAEALDMLAAVHYDIVLMDCHMPVMDGYEATRRIRADARYASLPIVAMTANAGPNGRALSLAAGMNDQVDKPIEADRLYRTLARWLSEPTADAAPVLTATAGGGERAVDYAAALHRLGGDEHIYRVVAQTFLDDWRGSFGERFRSARESDAVVRLAHTLKGTAAAIGATTLQQHAQALETALRADSAADAALDDVEGELARVRGELQCLLEVGR